MAKKYKALWVSEKTHAKIKRLIAKEFVKNKKEVLIDDFINSLIDKK